MRKWDIRSPLVCDSSIVLLAQQMIFLLSFLGTSKPSFFWSPMWPRNTMWLNSFGPYVWFQYRDQEFRVARYRRGQPQSHQGGGCRLGPEVESHLARSISESFANFPPSQWPEVSPDWFTPTKKDGMGPKSRPLGKTFHQMSLEDMPSLFVHSTVSVLLLFQY